MSTVRDLVTDALGEIGIVSGAEAATYEDAALGLRVLNRMVDQWSAEPLTIFNLQRITWDITANVSAYRVGTPGQAATFGALISDGFDTTWTDKPPGWTIGSQTGLATISNEEIVTKAGGHAIKLDAISLGVITLYRDFTVYCGEEATVTVWMRGNGGGTGVITRVQCIETGHYLTSSGGWQSASADLFTETAASFVSHSLTFDVEAAELVGSDTCTLRVTFYCDSFSPTGYFDSFSLANDVPTVVIPSIPIPWPSRIEHVHLLDTNLSPNTETELNERTEDGWADISQKDATSTYPTDWFYNPDLPDFETTRDVQGFFGTLTLWPVPTGTGLQGVAYVKTQITQFASLDSLVRLPPGFEEFIVTNLAARLCSSFNRKADPMLIQRAAEAKALVKRSNKRLSDLSFDAGALIGNRGGYNIFTDR